jgi:carbon monoxide dehydrogenase subunit G
VRLTQRATIAAPIDRAWALVMDLERAASCVPGVSGLSAVGPDRYRGGLPLQLGPVRIALEGELTIASRDDVARRATLRADAKDSRLGGTVRATIDLALVEGASGCELRVDGDVNIAGRIGEFGQPVIQRKAAQLLAQMTECLGRMAAA